MKFSTKAIVTSVLATIVVAGQAVANSDTQAAPTWQSHHSVLTKYPLYGNKKITTTTTTTNTAVDASRKLLALGSFNPTTGIASNSQKAPTSQYIDNGDDLAASNWQSQNGSRQSGYQGDASFLNRTGGGQVVSKDVGGFLNRVEDNRNVYTDVDQTLITRGNNDGNMINELQIAVNFDGKQGIDSVLDSTVGSRFGNDQNLSIGDQTQLQRNDLAEAGDNTALASNAITSSASNTSN